MANREKIPYKKKLPPKATKQLGSGGPRDMQRRQSGMGAAEINMPKIDIEALKEVLLNNKEARDELKAEIRREMEEVKEVVASGKDLEGYGLPFDVVEQKIKDAVQATEVSMRERYESGLGSLNSQLNSSKAQVKDLNKRLSERKHEINELKKQILDKDTLINDLREQQNQEVGDLKSKILDLIDKIKTGKITSDNYDDARPLLDDKIFIDPLSEVETDLDPHISVSAAEARGDGKRDLKSDVEKLKGLLDNKKYTPAKARIND